MINEFIYDLKTYSFNTAFFNLRWNIVFGFAKVMIRKPLQLRTHADNCGVDGCTYECNDD